MLFPEPKTCKDLNEEIFAYYSKSLDKAAVLLDHMARMASPFDCEAYILGFFARIAMRGWLQGDISLTILPISNYVTNITLATEPRDDDPEIVYQNDFRVSITEIKELIAYQLIISPFQVGSNNKSRITLIAQGSERHESLPPAAFSCADADLEQDNVYALPKLENPTFDAAEVPTVRYPDTEAPTARCPRPPAISTIIKVLDNPKEAEELKTQVG